MLLLLLFASSSDFFPLVNPVVPVLGRRTIVSFLVITSHGVNVLKVDVIQLTAFNI